MTVPQALPVEASGVPVLMLLTSLLPGLVIFFLREEQVRLRSTLNLAGAFAKVALVVVLIPPVVAVTHRLKNPKNRLR